MKDYIECPVCQADCGECFSDDYVHSLINKIELLKQELEGCRNLCQYFEDSLKAEKLKNEIYVIENDLKHMHERNLLKTEE